MCQVTNCGESEASRQDRIRDAALEVFAVHGTSETTLQMIAEAAGVSVGLIQHHFGSKDRVIAAVDGHVLTVIATTMSAPLPESATEAVFAVGQRINFLITEQVSVVDYLARMLVAGTPAGTAVFDALVTIGMGQWQQLADSGATDADIDVLWAALNPMFLALGAIILRRHLDRHLPEPFTTRTQQERWERAVRRLISQGQLRG
jgi:AcrR family transcriptional regulator